MAGFARDLEILDNTNNRTIDTAHVFYVQAGQTAPLDILSNVVKFYLPVFLDLPNHILRICRSLAMHLIEFSIDLMLLQLELLHA